MILIECAEYNFTTESIKAYLPENRIKKRRKRGANLLFINILHRVKCTAISTPCLLEQSIRATPHLDSSLYNFFFAKDRREKHATSHNAMKNITYV